MQDLLGMLLEDAVELMRQRGMEPEIILTRAPRGERDEGEKRVIRVRGNELTASVFQVDLPIE